MSSGGTKPREAQPGDELEARIRSALADGEAERATTLALRSYGPEIVRYLTALLGDETEVKEAFSLFGERLWQGVGTFRGESAIRTWMYRVAWSAASDLRKDTFRRRGRRLETGEAAGLAVPGGDRGTWTWLRLERRAIALDRLRERLTLEEQCLLQLRIDRELSWEDCARVLAGDGVAVAVPTLRKRFERIKARLRALLDGET